MEVKVVKNKVELLPTKLGLAYNIENYFEIIVKRDFSSILTIWEQYIKHKNQLRTTGYYYDQAKIKAQTETLEMKVQEYVNALYLGEKRIRRGAFNFLGNIVKARKS